MAKVAYSYSLPTGEVLEVGSEFTLKGTRGCRFRFLKAVQEDDGTVWIDCFGGTASKQKARSFWADQVLPLKGRK